MTGTPVYQCHRCSRLLPVTSEFFYFTQAGKFMRPCRRCRREQSHAAWEAIKADPVKLAEHRAENARRRREVRAENGNAADRMRAASRRWKARAEQDAAWKANARANRRINERLRAEREAGEMPERNYKHRAEFHGYVPLPKGSNGGSNHAKPILRAEPLAAWLRREFGAWRVADLARRLEMDEATLRRLINGQSRYVSLHIADRILVGADCVHLLALLYPPEDVAA